MNAQPRSHALTPPFSHFSFPVVRRGRISLRRVPIPSHPRSQTRLPPPGRCSGQRAFAHTPSWVYRRRLTGRLWNTTCWLTASSAHPLTPPAGGAGGVGVNTTRRVGPRAPAGEPPLPGRPLHHVPHGVACCRRRLRSNSAGRLPRGPAGLAVRVGPNTGGRAGSPTRNRKLLRSLLWSGRDSL